MPAYKLLATEIGDDAGPFDIKTNTGTVLATGVTRLQLLEGYIVNVPAGVVSLTVSNSASNVTCAAVSQTYTVPNYGLWEMEKAGVERVSDHYGVILDNYVVPVESFAAENVTGIYAGVVSGTGTWLIKAGPEDIGGTTYNGGGKLIVTGVNTNSQTTVESGATLQIGYDLNALAGQLGTNLTINAGGIVNAVGAYEAPGGRPIGNLTNNGTLTFEGPDRCGEGYFRLFGTANNSSVITVKDNAHLQLGVAIAFNTAVGTIRVEDGGTLEQNGATIPSNQTLALNGCGKCTNIGKQDGAVLVSGAATIASPIVLESDVCMDHVGSGTATISGRITGNYKLTIDNQAGTATRQGSWSFTSNSAPFFDNTLEVKGTTLYGTGANALSKADVVFVGNGAMQSDGGTINLGSLSSDSAASFLLLNSSGGIVLKENGETTFAGLLQNSTPGTPWPLTVEGPSTNKLTLTGSGNTAVNLNCNGGGKLVVQDGTFNQWMGAWNGAGPGNISAGNSRVSRINNVYMTATDEMDVYASGATTGMLWSPNYFAPAAGWKVNLMEPLPAGTHQIYKNTVGNLPTLGTNLSGRTVTGFANIGGFLTVTLA
jgi:hypothetical protein